MVSLRLLIYHISDTELHIDNHMAARCCDRSGFISGVTNMYGQNILIANVITVVGCDDYGNIYQADNDYLPKGCSTTCHNAGEVPKDEISGTGCCQKLYQNYTRQEKNKNAIACCVTCLCLGIRAVESATYQYNSTAIETNTNHTIMKAGGFAKPGCQRKCGSLDVPYPFGIISEGNRGPKFSLDDWFPRPSFIIVTLRFLIYQTPN
ncbi:hypothetical protein POM88_008074 [Heracleum sosnowskyi]|uniref:Uncharacterized protein n=1 Tax=Heracleum sosnowskyi TaxID=360622 RepID=A0AAD8J6R3_9APIA|nr:hypothetical protein POM88_008074 [Heracleum sosnowskyi]